MKRKVKRYNTAKFIAFKKMYRSSRESFFLLRPLFAIQTLDARYLLALQNTNEILLISLQCDFRYCYHTIRCCKFSIFTMQAMCIGH